MAYPLFLHRHHPPARRGRRHRPDVRRIPNPGPQAAPVPHRHDPRHDQNGSNVLGTPDDREGWREFFVRRGYAVYVVDQPVRGRSDTAPAGMPSTAGLQRQFTAIARYDLWPTAHLHTQWPGTGVAGDPASGQAEAAQQPSLRDNVRMDALNRVAGKQRLQRIGPAILLTHSRSGARHRLGDRQ